MHTPAQDRMSFEGKPKTVPFPFAKNGTRSYSTVSENKRHCLFMLCRLASMGRSMLTWLLIALLALGIRGLKLSYPRLANQSSV
jgi:hypothetical protein